MRTHPAKIIFPLVNCRRPVRHPFSSPCPAKPKSSHTSTLSPTTTTKTEMIVTYLGGLVDSKIIDTKTKTFIRNEPEWKETIIKEVGRSNSQAEPLFRLCQWQVRKVCQIRTTFAWICKMTRPFSSARKTCSTCKSN